MQSILMIEKTLPFESLNNKLVRELKFYFYARKYLVHSIFNGLIILLWIKYPLAGRNPKTNYFIGSVQLLIGKNNIRYFVHAGDVVPERI